MKERTRAFKIMTEQSDAFTVNVVGTEYCSPNRCSKLTNNVKVVRS